MNVCVVKEDKVVMIDGEGANFDFDLPSNVWAIQWNGTSGHIEFNDGTPNEALTDFSAYQSLVDGHAAEIQRKAQEDADEIANRDYKQVRALLYPDVVDQLDSLYHAGSFSEEMMAKIKAVKDSVPKS